MNYSQHDAIEENGPVTLDRRSFLATGVGVTAAFFMPRTLRGGTDQFRFGEFQSFSPAEP